MNKKDTITQALGLSDEWEEKNSEDILETLKESSLISDAIITHAQRIKMEEFDLSSLTEKDITPYERKLIWSGMEMAKIIYKTREQESPILGFIKMIQDLKKEEEKKSHRPKEDGNDNGGTH